MTLESITQLHKFQRSGNSCPLPTPCAGTEPFSLPFVLLFDETFKQNQKSYDEVTQPMTVTIP